MKKRRDRQSSRYRERIRIKLLLLLLGICMLVFLLPEQEEQKKDTEKKEENTEEKVPEREAETEEREKQEEAQPLYGDRIRVVIKTDQFLQVYHEKIVLSLESGNELCAVDADSGTCLGSGTVLTFSREDGTLFLNDEALALSPDCIRIEPCQEGEEGIRVDSLLRNSGTPVYEGSMEVWPKDQGFYLVNELPLETYLNYVVPSEMPSGYCMEALKAQAVCARTYAWGHLMNCAYPDCQAHVDDSVRYQVYNNTGTAEDTTRAVEETAGLVLTSEGQLITAYYFSTSCGATGNEEIWWEGDSLLSPYLQGKIVNESGETAELEDEQSFREFLEEEDPDCYDAEISWYRWETEVDVDTLSKNLNAALKGRYEANPEAVLTRTEEGYESLPTETVGIIQGIDVLERNKGGAIERILVRGSKETIEVFTEYNVRALLNVQGCMLTRNDGSEAEGGSVLPSACMTVDPLFEEDGELYGWRFRGGGYGHGTGLSQNGANKMAEQGKTFAEILNFFYTEVDLTSAAELW